MFSKILGDNKIPPNFLDSILTNTSLYEMFKESFDENISYFGNRSKDEYLNAILCSIEDKLFNDEDIVNNNSFLDYTLRFYDDFLLKEFKDNPEDIFKTSFFKGMHKNYLKCAESEKFNKLYNYIFFESMDYKSLSDSLINPLIEKLQNYEKLSILEFDLLSNYVKNNIDGKTNINIVCAMIKNHAYKKNHIFDRDVVKNLCLSIADDYLESFGLSASIEFMPFLSDNKSESVHDIKSKTIKISSILVDTFITGNYVELLHILFYEMTIMKNALLLEKNEVNYETLKVIMGLINEKVDLNRIFKDEEYAPYSYFADLKASSFVETLKFYQSLGVDLFKNYINSKMVNTASIESLEVIPKKEISIEMAFEQRFIKLGEEKISEYRKSFPVLSLFYGKDGCKKRTIDLIKSVGKDENKQAIFDFLRGTIITPEAMIEDVNDLVNFKFKSEEASNLRENLIKYIYVDAFYYSLDSYLKLNMKRTNFDRGTFIDDLTVKVSCIKDTPISHRFIDEVLNVLEEAKQKE